MLTGWGRLVLKKLDMLSENLRALSDGRIKICDTCPMRSSNVCSVKKRGIVVKDFNYKGKPRKKGERVSGCGCNLAAKTLEEKQQCPLGKW